MSASLTREPRIRQLLPVAIAQRWGVRRLAKEARIGYGAAGAALRSAAQRAATEASADPGSLSPSVSAEIRDAVGKGARALISKIEAALAGADAKPDAASLERLGRTLETAVRVANDLDGLGHVRALQTGILKRMDSDSLARLKATPTVDDPWEDSMESFLAAHQRQDRAVPAGPQRLRAPV